MHGLYTYLERLDGSPDPAFHEMSHGESFLSVLERKFDSPGFYVLDEPESALSFTGCLALVGHLHALVGSGGQVVMATHSPIIAAMPDATLLEVGDWGLRAVTWDELALVDHWRRFLSAPQAYLRHVLSNRLRAVFQRSRPLMATENLAVSLAHQPSTQMTKQDQVISSTKPILWWGIRETRTRYH